MSKSADETLILSELSPDQKAIENEAYQDLETDSSKVGKNATDQNNSANAKQGELLSSEDKKNSQLDAKDSERTRLIHIHGLTVEEAARLHKAAFIISWVSVIFSVATGVVGIVLSIKGKSESLFAYGLDAILDSLSSLAVVWRFFSDDTFSKSRERHACIIIGFLFLVSSISLITKSIQAIMKQIHETKNIVLYECFALICGTIAFILASSKVYLGHKLDSQALITDSIITYVGVIMCVAGVTGLELYIQDNHLWYLDSMFGIICGTFLFLFGCRLLYVSYFYKDSELNG